MYVWYPQAITAWSNANGYFDGLVVRNVIVPQLDEHGRKTYEWVEWGEDKLAKAIKFGISRLPKNKQAHTEALLHLKFRWKELALELLVVLLAVWAVLKFLWRLIRGDPYGELLIEQPGAYPQVEAPELVPRQPQKPQMPKGGYNLPLPDRFK